MKTKTFTSAHLGARITAKHVLEDARTLRGLIEEHKALHDLAAMRAVGDEDMQVVDMIGRARDRVAKAAVELAEQLAESPS